SNKTGEVIIREVDPKTEIFNYQDLLKDLDKLKYLPNFKFPLNWDRQHEDKLKERGVTEYKHLFTERNYALNCFIFNDIIDMQNKIDQDFYERLYFLFSSSLRYTNNMTRVTANWENGNPTSMDKHAYWLPNQYVETNILAVIKKRMKSVLKGMKYSKEN